MSPTKDKPGKAEAMAAETKAKRPRSKNSSGSDKPHLGRWVVLVLAVLGLAYAGVLEYQRPHVDGDALRFDTFVRLVVAGNIDTATVLDQDAYIVGVYEPAGDGELDGDVGDLGLGHGHDGGGVAVGEPAGEGELPEGELPQGTARYNAPLVDNTQGQVLQLLVEEGVPTTVDQQVGKQLAQFASMLLPGVMLVVLFIYMILSYRMGTGLFGVRSGARQFAAEDPGTARFADVAGQDQAVAELREIAEFLAEPERFEVVGAAAPKGVLLYGPPGCGKTLLAKALAGEAGASFFSISGADFVELYQGVGAARVRDLFDQAREAAPALVFIDEIDAIGRARSTGEGVTGGQGEQEQALNQILSEMDGFAASDGLIVLAATNRADLLDQALLRPGRFDRTVGLERPDEQGRLAILELHAHTRELAGDVDLPAIAHQAIGLTGADLATVVNEAALLAARAGKSALSQRELDAAVQRVVEAPERQRRLSLRDRSVAHIATADERLTLADVAGADDAAAELADVLDYLADPERFAAMGAHPPQGILLSGPPGCGKTLLARALAGEANAAFLSAAGSEFVEVYAGKGAQRVRDLFGEAAAVAPAIVFLDEIDAIGSQRRPAGGSSEERAQTLNQILVELDGFTPRTAVVVIAATNRPDILDTALVRPGRFDRHVVMSLPDRAGRRGILELHTGDKPLAPDVDLGVVADLTAGFSGAALAGVANDAALLATRRGQPVITMALVEEAVDRAAAGVASRGWVMSDSDRQVAAYHAAARSLVAHRLTGAVPRKLALAAGTQAPGHGAGSGSAAEGARPLAQSREALIGRMTVLLAGRAGEELALDQPTGAASGDLAQAEALAHQMVCAMGMSPTLGPLVHPDGDTGHPGWSEQTAQTIEADKHALITEAYQQARRVLAADRDALERLAVALLDHETVAGEEFIAVVDGGTQPTTAQAHWR